MKRNHQELEAVIEELANPNFDIYSHGIFGCFGEKGHFLKETKGPNKRIKHYADKEEGYGILFENEEDGIEFKARVWAEKVHEGFKFRLIFNDRRGDHRGASHTDYTLLVPESKSSQVKPHIESNPALLIEVFRKVFPDYDRSSGTLSMHDVTPYFEKR